MSTYLYLECAAHEPAISSGNEVGQHLFDLPAVREYIKHRDALVEVSTLEGVDLIGYASAAAHFLAQHPACPIQIRDEYGKKHELEETKE